MDPHIRALATDIQAKYWEAKEVHGSETKAAAAMGVRRTTLSRSLRGLEKKVKAQQKREYIAPPPRPAESGKRILVLPDVQAKPGVDFSFLRRIGMYALEKRPDRIVCGGDFGDLPSLSSYDKGKKAFEGRRYKRDVEATQYAMHAFLGPIREHNDEYPEAPYLPEMDLLYGNHEERILRAVNEDAKLEGVLSLKDLGYEEFGWRVHKFLEVVQIEGVAFSHYFVSGVMGRPITTARALLTKKHQSCIAFHQQGLQIATDYRADGTLLTAVICGSCYEGEEEYLGPQGNKHWRGFLMMHAVKDGAFDLMPVSLDYVNKKYPDVHVEPPIYSMPTADEIAAGRV